MGKALSHSESVTYRLGMQMRRETWRNFQIDFGGSVLFALFNVVVNQFYAPMAIRHGATNLDVGLLSAAPAIGMLLSPLWAGLMGQRSPKPFVLWPLTIGRMSVVIAGMFLSPLVFVLISFVVNFMNGIQAPAYPSLLTRVYPPHLRGRLMGYVRVAQGFLLIPLAYVVGIWSQATGDRWPLILAALFGTASVILFCRVREVEPRPETNENMLSAPRRSFLTSARRQWLLVRENRPLALFLAATTATGFGNLLAGPIYQIYQVHRLNLSNDQIGMTRVAYYIALLVAYFVLGWLIDKSSPRLAMFVGMLAYTLAPLLYVVFGSYFGVIVSCMFLGVGDAAWDIGCMAYIFKVSPGREATAFGLHYLLFGIRGTVAPILSTALTHNMSLSAVFLASAAVSALGVALLCLPQRPPTLPSGTSSVSEVS
ncbi:hypothetical protein Alches_11190 [Alicyclobacillus hesperidum subsp. aegles]|uniref:MFS transporter n=1 Tax=Alicyclobacillus hesperidum TaxID=89784 RepID=UPI0022291D62|nr:MFS transporter [Alicyclobacillus hesperidum]GLG01080.1 hypothetical protein Alches_11190 [Alicyclobacillus hesperidum subsp. aegles]